MCLVVCPYVQVVSCVCCVCMVYVTVSTCPYVRESAVQAVCVCVCPCIGQAQLCLCVQAVPPTRSSPSVCESSQCRTGSRWEGERCWGCPSAPTPPPLPQSRDRTLFRVAIRHLFSNLISSELYFPSLRKIIFHRSRARPLPRTAAAAASIYLRAEPGRAAARAGERAAPRRSEGGGGGGRGTAGEEGAQRHGPLCPDPEPGSQLPASLLFCARLCWGISSASLLVPLVSVSLSLSRCLRDSQTPSSRSPSARDSRHPASLAPRPGVSFPRTPWGHGCGIRTLNTSPRTGADAQGAESE